MTSYFEYIVTSLDMHSIDLEDFKFGGTNITAFRLVDPHNPEVVEVNLHSTKSSNDKILSFTGSSFLDSWRKEISITSVSKSSAFYQGRDGPDL